MIPAPQLEKYTRERLLDDLHVALAAVHEHKIIWTNDAFSELTGYKQVDMMGKEFTDVLEPSSAKRVRKLRDELLQGSRFKANTLVHLTTKNGEEVDVHVFLQQISINGTSCILYSMWDDTERVEREERIREQRDFLDSIFQGTAIALFIIDVRENGEFVYAGLNPAHERISGFSDEAIRGKTPDELVPWVPPEVPEVLKKNYQKPIDARGVVTYEEMIPMKGKNIWWLTTLTPLFDSRKRIYRIIGAATDITEMKVMEQKLVTHKEELELANEEINTLNENLEKIVEERTFQLRERMKELNCLFELNSLLYSQKDDLGETFRKFIKLIPESWLDPEHTEARIVFHEEEYVTTEFRKTPWMLHREILDEEQKPIGSVTVSYTRESKQDPFLQEEHTLLKAIVKRIQDFYIYQKVQTDKDLQLNQFMAIMHRFPEIIYIIDPHTYEVVFVNRHWEDQLGFDPIGQKCYKAFQGLDEPCPFCTNEELLEGTSDLKVWEHHNKVVNKHYYITDQLADWPDGRKVRFEVAVDISELKKVQKELKRVNTHLEDMVKERTLELEDAIRELEGFSYTVSHDLKAPLRSITGYSNILLEDYREELPEDAQDVLDVIIRNTEKMRQLIDDILQINRLGRKETRPKELNLNNLVNSIYRNYGGSLKHRTIHFEIRNKLPTIEADPVMMEQLFSNLILNAIKFTEGRNFAEITMDHSMDDGTHIISIEDNGVGYDDRFEDKLFQIFQRLHSEREFSGSGVGLAICKRILDKHGGRIWSESTLGEGATFYVQLPQKHNNKKLQP